MKHSEAFAKCMYLLESEVCFQSACNVKLFILCAAGAAVGNRREMEEIRYNFGLLQNSE